MTTRKRFNDARRSAWKPPRTRTRSTQDLTVGGNEKDPKSTRKQAPRTFTQPRQRRTLLSLLRRRHPESQTTPCRAPSRPWCDRSARRKAAKSLRGSACNDRSSPSTYGITTPRASPGDHRRDASPAPTPPQATFAGSRWRSNRASSRSKRSCCALAFSPTRRRMRSRALANDLVVSSQTDGLESALH